MQLALLCSNNASIDCCCSTAILQASGIIRTSRVTPTYFTYVSLVPRLKGVLVHIAQVLVRMRTIPQILGNYTHVYKY